MTLESVGAYDNKKRSFVGEKSLKEISITKNNKN